MTLQTILQIVAMLSVLIGVVLIVIGALRFSPRNFTDLWQQINQRPIMGPLLRVTLPLGIASIALEAVMRIGRLF